MLTDTTRLVFKQFIESLPRGKEVMRDMIAADLSAYDARIAVLEGLELGAVADAAALVAISTTDLQDGSLVTVESTNVLYRFNKGEAAGSANPPETYDATDAGGVWYQTVAKTIAIHDPKASIAALKAIPAKERNDKMLCSVADNGAGLKDVYWFVAGDATAESLPNVVAPTAGTGRWFALRFLLTSSFEAAGALSGHLGAFAHANIPTTNEKNNLEFSVLTVATLKAMTSHVSGQRALVYDSGDGKAGLYKYDATDVTLEAQVARFGNFYSHIIPDDITHPAAGRWVREGYATDNFPSQAAAAAAAGRVMESGGVDKSQVATTIPTADLVTNATGVAAAAGYALESGGNDKTARSSGVLISAMNAKTAGSVGCAIMAIGMGDNFTAGVGHIDIGGDVWNCIAGVPGAGTKEFQIGADRDASIVNAAAKINDATRGTAFVLAEPQGSGEMLLSFATAVGGTAVVGVPTSMALAVVPGGAGTMTWDHNNLNESGAAASAKSASGRVVIGAAAAAKIAASGMVFLGVLPFTATATSALRVQVFSAAGLVKACDDLFELGADDVTVTGAAGAVPLIDTDVVHWSVIGG